MKKLFPATFVLCLAAASCSSAPPPARPVGPSPERAQIPSRIMGVGVVAQPRLEAFLVGANPAADRAAVRELASAYIEECAAEGVNHDVAFSQMCVETGYLRFGGLVTADMNNYCGLGSMGPGKPGERFPSPRIGVRAHVQHLKGYATAAPLRTPLADPRYRYVKYGTAPTVASLSGKWAADPDYGNKITRVVRRLYGIDQ